MDSCNTLTSTIQHIVADMRTCLLNKNEEQMLQYVQQLTDLPITVSHLEETNIGRTMNALRKVNGKVGIAATILLYHWKNMVIDWSLKQFKYHKINERANTADKKGGKNDTKTYSKLAIKKRKLKDENNSVEIHNKTTRLDNRTEKHTKLGTGKKKLSNNENNSTEIHSKTTKPDTRTEMDTKLDTCKIRLSINENKSTEIHNNPTKSDTRTEIDTKSEMFKRRLSTNENKFTEIHNKSTKSDSRTEMDIKLETLKRKLSNNENHSTEIHNKPTKPDTRTEMDSKLGMSRRRLSINENKSAEIHNKPTKSDARTEMDIKLDTLKRKSNNENNSTEIHSKPTKPDTRTEMDSKCGMSKRRLSINENKSADIHNKPTKSDARTEMDIKLDTLKRKSNNENNSTEIHSKPTKPDTRTEMDSKLGMSKRRLSINENKSAEIHNKPTKSDARTEMDIKLDTLKRKSNNENNSTEIHSKPTKPDTRTELETFKRKFSNNENNSTEIHNKTTKLDTRTEIDTKLSTIKRKLSINENSKTAKSDTRAETDPKLDKNKRKLSINQNNSAEVQYKTTKLDTKTETESVKTKMKTQKDLNSDLPSQIKTKSAKKQFRADNQEKLDDTLKIDVAKCKVVSKKNDLQKSTKNIIKAKTRKKSQENNETLDANLECAAKIPIKTNENVSESKKRKVKPSNLLQKEDEVLDKLKLSKDELKQQINALHHSKIKNDMHVDVQKLTKKSTCEKKNEKDETSSECQGKSKINLDNKGKVSKKRVRFLIPGETNDECDQDKSLSVITESTRNEQLPNGDVSSTAICQENCENDEASKDGQDHNDEARKKIISARYYIFRNKQKMQTEEKMELKLPQFADSTTDKVKKEEKYKVKKESDTKKHKHKKISDKKLRHKIKTDPNDMKINTKPTYSTNVKENHDTLFVNNLPENISSQDLSQYFSTYGDVIHCSIFKEHAYITFCDDVTASYVLNLTPHRLKGKFLTVTAKWLQSNK